ncbi:MAG TPA: hypothetical protein VG368_06530 [Acidimicrobiales bacterium]|nr:hypothetical protein [Acidimicrobiales bacterium]
MIDPGPVDQVASHGSSLLPARDSDMPWGFITIAITLRAPEPLTRAPGSHCPPAARPRVPPRRRASRRRHRLDSRLSHRGDPIPGRSSDHTCFIADRDKNSVSTRFCFSGDHVMGIVLLDGSMSAYLRSLERLMALNPPITTIAPGHGESISDPEPVLRNYLENRKIARAARLRRADRGDDLNE